MGETVTVLDVVGVGVLVAVNVDVGVDISLKEAEPLFDVE